MLDQNTDRMWYVIGAVLIGAAIILGMNTFMPKAFASVTDSFSQVTEQTTDAVDDMTAPTNLLGDEVYTGRQTAIPSRYTYNFSGGGYISLSEIGLAPGDTVTYSADYDTGDVQIRPRVNFSPVPYDTDDEREMARYGDFISGDGRFSATFEIPETTEYLRVMISHSYRDDYTSLPDIQLGDFTLVQEN